MLLPTPLQCDSIRLVVPQPINQAQRPQTRHANLHSGLTSTTQLIYAFASGRLGPYKLGSWSDPLSLPELAHIMYARISSPDQVVTQKARAWPNPLIKYLLYIMTRSGCFNVLVRICLNSRGPFGPKDCRFPHSHYLQIQTSVTVITCSRWKQLCITGHSAHPNKWTFIDT